ncbi:MAG: Mth938-like domain-containing protein [Gammaproteobacteria bacterium]
MPLAEDKITSRYSISAYNADEIVINEQIYRQSLVLSAEFISCPWPVRSISELDESSLEIILDMNPDVLLLGTGEQQQFPEARIFALLGQQGIGLEVMNNGALCRTFNILVAEDRAVVAAIMQAG